MLNAWQFGFAAALHQRININLASVCPRIEPLHHFSTVSHVTPQGHACRIRFRVNGNIAAPGTGCSYPAKDDTSGEADDPDNKSESQFAW